MTMTYYIIKEIRQMRYSLSTKADFVSI